MQPIVARLDAGLTAYDLRLPKVQTAPLIVSSPHSGRFYPECFLAASRLGLADLRRSEDAYVDKMVTAAPDLGVPVLAAHLARAYIDLNREPFELDPAMFGDSLPDFVNVRSARVAAGLGTVARCAGEGMDIYCQKLSFDTIMSRITDYYFPYHHALDRLIQQTRARFSASLLLDCHSMPSQQRPRSPNGAARLKGEPTRRTVQRRTTTTLADIVLGDNHSRSCAPWVTQVASDYFEQCGYHVARNQPYAGGYITVHRGKPDNGVHALQIEVNRALYMDEVSLQPNTALESLTSDMTGLVRTLIDAASFQLITPQAAE